MIRQYIKTETRIFMDRFITDQEVICDVCKTVLGKNDGFFQVTTHHDRWGNDSIDTFETRHFCCKECMDSFLDGYWDNPKNTDAADIEYLETVSRARCSPDDHIEKVDMDKEES